MRPLLLLLYYSLIVTNVVSSLSIIMPATTEHLFRVRTITAFLHLTPDDFESSSSLELKIQQCSNFLSSFQTKLTTAGYEVQTVRIATNPFGQYLVHQDSFETRLERLDALLSKHDIHFCSLGPATSLDELEHCPTIVAKSPRLSCSATIQANDVEMARATADCIIQISKLNAAPHVDGGLGNFRFCAASCCQTANIPFFPAAVALSDQERAFALGLENGPLAYELLAESGSIAKIPTTFLQGMTAALKPLEELCTSVAATVDDDNNWKYLGIDTSLNPALDRGEHGSVAAAVETLEEVVTFGGPGTVAAAAAVTQALQALPGITKTGYCGFMLPVCEDLRLADLAPQLRISNLLSISAVCGVGVDTVPIAGDVSASLLTSLLLDVANLANRWNKPLSCRVFPVPGTKAGETTQFDSPYLCNSQVFSIE